VGPFVSTSEALEHARLAAQKNGHALGAWRPFAGKTQLLEARCQSCRRSVWVGRREAFGTPLTVWCKEPT
jgi:hypothetical protein